MLRKKFPRMFALRDQIKSPNSLNPFWKDFYVTFLDPLKGLTMQLKWLPYEAAMQSLDSDAWQSLRNRAANLLTKWDEKNARGQQELVDMLNEALAYSFLKSEIGCSDIRFIPPSQKKYEETPDLEGTLEGIKVICEVKTINISDDEALTRREMSHSFRPRCDQPSRELGEDFLNKLSDKLAKAKNQIQAYYSSNAVRRIVYIIPKFDDMWETHKEEYFKEIDDSLSKNIIQGIEIVFHNQRTVSNEVITMKNATVFNEPEYS